MTTNKLQEINNVLNKKTIEKIQEIRKKRDEHWYIDFNSYEINRFNDKLFDVLSDFDEVIKTKNDIQLTFVDRNKFDADFSIKIPWLLQKYKKDYVREVVPKLIDFLNDSKLVKENIILKIEWIWIYLNITLNDAFHFNIINNVFNKQEKYWETDLYKQENIIVDYSSPNVAKHLHAGHIRSTIIGHVLANLYDVNWYYTHRINHINDWGGFGFLIEWYNRFQTKLPNFENKNDLLFYIYTIYRTGEKASKDLEEFNKNDEKLKYFWDFDSYEDFKELFNDFLESGRQRFRELEAWKPEIVDLWQEMVSWSLSDFEKFYDLLGIHQDYVIWESFYTDYWVNLVMQLEKEWKVVLYTKEMADNDIKKLEEKLNNQDIEIKYFEMVREEILRDVWAYVVLLDNLERFVVLKSDKSSIYATRDLAAIKYRTDTFSPREIIYEVWQEQAEHFDKLFKSARKIWINDVDFKHIYHWFYVDLKTKKKLSSRDWASNVIKLLNESIKYFESKYKDSDEFSKEEINDMAYKLAIGSIIFNDIKSDKKNPVAISSNLEETFKMFEESGWAYVMYSIVRANSILKKIDKVEEIKVENIKIDSLENIEKQILNEILRLPLVVKQAWESSNPSVLVEYILNLSRNYNSYYNSHRVMDKQKIIESRVLLTKAVSIVLTNALKICHIEVPERI